MRTCYQPLFRLRLRHGFYATGASVRDLTVEPSASTRRTLAASGLLFRRLADGGAVLGEVEPESTPPRLLRPLGEDTLRLTFLLLPAQPHLWNISDLPEYQPGLEVFYFNNLRDDQADGRLHLGDSVAGQRVGQAIALVAGSTYSYHFPVPVSAASFDVRDLFDRCVFKASFTLPQPTSELRLELGPGNLPPGRYAFAAGAAEAFYYDPEIFARRPFGVVEIFSRTDALSAGDRVPPAYRFLNGDELTGVKDYVLQLEPRSTTWRYNVIKKYGSNGLTLDELSISDPSASNPVIFAKDPDPVPVAATQVTFTSTALVELSERPRGLELKGVQSRIRDLPDPAAATPLAAGAVPGELASEIYVYV